MEPGNSVDCLSCFTTAKISFTSILYPQFTHDLYHIRFTSVSFISVIVSVIYVLKKELFDFNQTL